MKKIILIFLFIAKLSYADSIPGWLELDLNYQDWEGVGSNTGYANTEVDINYGFTFNSSVFSDKIYKFPISPYLKCGWLTYFDKGQNVYNYPFRDIYTFGSGLRINEVFYFEYMHKCAHYVRATGNDANRLYEMLPGTAHNIFKVGLKIKID
jgi:hypothetical protein